MEGTLGIISPTLQTALLLDQGSQDQKKVLPPCPLPCLPTTRAQVTDP